MDQFSVYTFTHSRGFSIVWPTFPQLNTAFEYPKPRCFNAIVAYMFECVLQQALYIDATNKIDLSVYTNVTDAPIDPSHPRKVTICDLYGGDKEIIESVVRLAVGYMYGM